MCSSGCNKGLVCILDCGCLLRVRYWGKGVAWSWVFFVPICIVNFGDAVFVIPYNIPCELSSLTFGRSVTRALKHTFLIRRILRLNVGIMAIIDIIIESEMSLGLWVLLASIMLRKLFRVFLPKNKWTSGFSLCSEKLEETLRHTKSSSSKGSILSDFTSKGA